MTAIRRQRAVKAGIFAASAAGHLLLFLLIGQNAPGLRERLFEDEDAVMVVDLLRPPSPPRSASPEPRPAPTARPTAVRPRQAVQPPPAAVLPLPMAPDPQPAARPAPLTGAGSGGASLGPGAAPPGGDLRGALRGSTVGCANRAAVGLNRRENESCDERLGAGAADAPYIGAPMDPDKRARFDARAAAKARDRRWRETAPPVGVDHKVGPGQVTGLDKP